MTTDPTRCLCSHGPSRHFHIAGSTSCRVCSCHTYRPRCTHMVYTRATYPVPPARCTRAALGDSGLCRQHGGEA